MNRFLVVGFDFCKSFYQSLVLCKPQRNGVEYRITIMYGELEKELCKNNTIREVNGCLELELTGETLHDQVKITIAKALGRMLGKPVREMEMPKKAGDA